ncbi:MAG: IclR family transcriptional regulator [Steroidobacteraceae bacterium]
MIVRQASHVLDLLEYFLQVKEPLNLAEISSAMGWPRSSTFNLLTTLAQRGFLYERRPRGGYYPSPRWNWLLQGIAESEFLPEDLRRTVEEVAHATGETVLVTAPAGTNVIFLYVVESSAPIRFSAQVGHQMPIHSTASGRALLAQYSSRERASVLRRAKFDKNAPRPATNAEQVEAEIKRAATRGWHENIGGYIPDLCGVALPLGLLERRLSIVVGGPTNRMRSRIPQIAATLKRALKRHVSSPKLHGIQVA